MKMDKQESVKVTDPKTNKTYDCEMVINTLLGLYLKGSSNTPIFIEWLKLLSSAIIWNDNLGNDIKRLGEILSTYGLGSEFEEQLNKIFLRTQIENTEYIPIYDKYKELYSNMQREKGLSFLVPIFDKYTGGIMPGTICTIVGAPGSMKTTYAVNISYQAAVDGKNVCYLSLEESPVQLFSKLMSRVSKDIYGKEPLNVNDVVRGNLSEVQKDYLLGDVLNHLINLDGQIDIIGENDLKSLDFKSIERKLRQVDDYMKNSGNHGGINVIVVDHIQLFKYASSEKDEKSLMNSYVSFFRKQSLSFLGEDRQVVIILLSQVNREGIKYAQRHDGTYLIDQIAEGSEIERSSTYIISTYSDSMIQISKQLKVGAIKFRNAQLPEETIVVSAEGEFYQVGDIAIPEQMDYSTDSIMGSTPSSEISIDDLIDENMFNF